jgi:glucose/mannose transport system substrate-binding protein
MLNRSIGACFAAASLVALPVQASEVEVLHWWTSGGEAKSVASLKSSLEKRGVSWQDFAVAGGGGENAMTVLKSRAVSGNPPTAAQIKGPDIQEWGELGFLASIDDVAKKDNWDDVLPGVVSDVMKYKGKYVAAPVNVHRVNWLWANPEVFRKAGASIPTTWTDFMVQAKKIQDAGYIALAHGGQAWQDNTVFEAVVLGVGGAEYYKKAFVELDMDALNSSTTDEVFKVFGELRQFIDANAPGRDWNVATSMVINGEAAMQIMGDWAKGEFAAAGLKPDVDYYCASTPSDNGYLYNVDSFIFFKIKGEEKVEGQKLLASLIMGKEFQKVFNIYKGSIPARLDVPMDDFDKCAKKSNADLNTAAKSGGLLPSFAHGMTLELGVKGAIQDVVTEHFNSDMSSQDAVSKLSAAVKAAS